MKNNIIFASIYTPSLSTMLTWACFSILMGCATKKSVSNQDIKKDSIIIENKIVQIDTIYKERIKTIFEQVNNDVLIPCDSSNFTQSFESGKIKYKIIKEKGSVRVVFRRDSSHFYQSNEYKYIYRQNDSLKRLISIHDKIEKKEVIKTPFLANLWRIAFLMLLVLWIFGITPRFILDSIMRL